MQPLVSIVIPTFNRAHLIGATLDSIMAQTYLRWECIVVDDGSRDGTIELMDEFCSKDSRFQYYNRPNTKPKGANSCRNIGYDLSKGDLIQWFDSDDLMHPEMLKRKVELALSEKADVIVSRHTYDPFSELEKEPEMNVFDSSEFYIDYILGKKPLITNDVLLRREVIGDNRFDENLHKAQEYEFFTRLFDQSLRYCFIDLILVFYRETENSISKLAGMGNTAQVESLVYLSKKLQERHAGNELIIERARRQGRKTYKSLIKRKNLFLIYKHFNFFKEAYYKKTVPFFLFIWLNFLTGRGFDLMKPKKNIS